MPATMKPTALRIIRDEHLAIASVLYSLRTLVRQIRDQNTAPDFRLLGAMLDYIVVFPERLHHPKEDRYLFAALERRCSEAAAAIRELQQQHRQGADLIENLKATLTAYIQNETAGFPAFAAAVEDYARFHWQHMIKEEDEILPLAERWLTEDDWSEIAEAFRANDNPLFGLKPREQTEQLYQKILSLTPAPVDDGDKVRRA